MKTNRPTVSKKRVMSEMTPEDWEALRYEAVQLFSPFAPIIEHSLFAGRIQEIGRMLEAINERGKHVLLFGEQGVGKTSLVNVLEGLFPPTLKRIRKYRIQADPTDTFVSLWKKAFREIDDDLKREGGSDTRGLM